MAKNRKQIARMWDTRAAEIEPYTPPDFPEPNPVAPLFTEAEWRKYARLIVRMKKAGL